MKNFTEPLFKNFELKITFELVLSFISRTILFITHIRSSSRPLQFVWQFNPWIFWNLRRLRDSRNCSLSRAFPSRGRSCRLFASQINRWAGSLLLTFEEVPLIVTSSCSCLLQLHRTENMAVIALCVSRLYSLYLGGSQTCNSWFLIAFRRKQVIWSVTFDQSSLCVGYLNRTPNFNRPLLNLLGRLDQILQSGLSLRGLL